jgi:lipoprotein-releasing system ATP-binding protein
MMKISVRELTRKYQDAQNLLTIIDSLSFDFEPGKGTAILGKSGVGKSTLLHLLAGLDRASCGSILYDGIDLCGMDSEKMSFFRQQNIGFVFQFHYLLPEFDALENVAMPLIITGASEESANQQASKLLEAVGLSSRRYHRPGQLSGGEQQRVAIARALVNKPQVLLADEPTGNLDPTTSREIQELLFSIQREYQITLILATHNQDLAASMDIRLEMLSGGELKIYE